MKASKVLALVLAVILAIGCLAACADGGDTTTTGGATKDEQGGSAVTVESWSDAQIAEMGEEIKAEAAGKTISLKVWGPEKAQDILKAETAAFAEIFKDYATIKFEVAVQGEGDAAANVITDPKAAADVFGYASDQIGKLYKANALAQVYFPANVTADNDAISVAAATVDGKIMSYPETGDNSYILTYDKRLVTDEQAKSLEGIFEACNASGKKFIFPAGDGFFASSFLYTGGVITNGTEEDGETQAFNDYDIDKATATVKAFADVFTANKAVFEVNNTTAVTDGYKNGTVAAGISGSWDMASVKEVLGDNIGFAVLPTINVEGTDTPIINMFGYKFLGVNSQSQYPTTAQCLAYYLAAEKCQQERAEQLDWGPSNINVQNSEFVKNSVSMTTFIAQATNSVSMSTIAGNVIFDPLGALGKYITEPQNDHSSEAIQKEIKACIANMRDE